jgi:hypothetical protein
LEPLALFRREDENAIFDGRAQVIYRPVNLLAHLANAIYQRISLFTVAIKL